MFRFFRKENLKSSRRRSASCPNLQHSSTEEIQFDGNYQKGKPVDDFIESSESDSDEHDSANKLERLNAERSVRRFKQKEKEKKENAHTNLISMDDYHGKLSELKMWLQEEGKKDISTLKSPKLKSHFKVFIKLWNKRKLPAKYYKNLSVDMTKFDQPASVEGSSVHQYIQHMELTPAPPLLPKLPPPLDLSINDNFNTISSPFSTFGKTPDHPNSTPAFLAQQMGISHAVEQTSNVNKESAQVDLDIFSVPSLDVQNSAQKFATISRSTPVTSLFKPWISRGNVTSPAVPSPVCPKVEGPNFLMAYKNKPQGSHTLPCNFTPVVNADKDLDKWIAGWNKFTDQSPIYDTVMDAIQCSSESPIYTEIDSDIQTDYQYLSVSPLKNKKSPVTEIKQTAIKQPSLNRRRSKSMEDIYSISSKFTGTGNKKWPNFLKDDSIQSQPLPPPPIPEKKFSPKKLFSTFISPRVTKIHTVVGSEGKSNLVKSPSLRSNKTIAWDLTANTNESNNQKRRSEESIDCTQEQPSSPVKKVKADSQLHAVGHSAHFPNIKNMESSSSLESCQDSFTSSTSKLSILTGSLHPTTRSKYKLNDSDASHNSHAEKSDIFDTELSILELKQLEESPKFPRRRLKRRSSSFSTTPGKSLIFGKTSKVSAASPRRRVSFAKDVKDAENAGEPKRRSSNRMVVSPNSAKFSKQSKDRMEFESFMSAHTSPPNKSYSPTKLQSPDKVSPKKLASPQDRSGEATRFDKARTDPPPNSPQKQKSPMTSQSDAKLFPPSPVKQLGRRIIGKPTAASPPSHMVTALQISPNKYLNKNSTCPVKTFNSSTRKDAQLFPPKKLFDSQLVLPKKTIGSLVSKLGEKTSTICGTEMSESEGYSSSDDLLNCAGSEVKEIDYCNSETNSVVSNLGHQENEINNGLNWNIHENFSLPKLLSNTISKKFPPEELRPTCTNKIGLSKLDHSVRNFNSETVSVSESKYSTHLNNNTTSYDGQQSICDTVTYTTAQTSYQGISMHAHLSSNSCLKNNESITAIESGLEKFAQETQTLNSAINEHCKVLCNSIKDNQETSIHKPAWDNLTGLPSLVRFTENNQVKDAPIINDSLKKCRTSSFTKEISPFTARPTQLDAQVCKSPICSLDENTQVLGQDQIDYENLWDAENNKESSQQDQKQGLGRLYSIRASPKIVDNDGWITERRRSSKGKIKASFRSAYNSYMLRSSSQEEEVESMDEILSTSVICVSPEPTLTERNVTQYEEVTSESEMIPVKVVHLSDIDIPSLELSSPQATLSTPQTSIMSKMTKPPTKIKPAIMPKPTKTISLAQQRTNQNSPALPTNTVSKRHSSLKKIEANIKHKEDYIKKNISAVRSDSSQQANTVAHQTVVAARKCNTTVDVNQLINRQRSKTANYDVDGRAPAGRRVSKVVQEGETTRGANKRRSRTTYQEDENKILSFTDRKKFFQQFQAKAEQKQSTRLSPQKQQRGLTSVDLKDHSGETLRSSPSLKSVKLEHADKNKQLSHNYSVETQI